MAVQVTVVEDPGSSFFGSLLTRDGNLPLWWDYLLKSDVKCIKSVDDFVRVCVEAEKTQGKIDYIQINGHGNNQSFQIGNDCIDLGSINKFKSKLATIAALLNKGCAVEISACKAGNAIELMRQFSLALGGVGIIGFLIPQSGGAGFVSPPVVVTPGGSYTTPAPASGGNSLPGTPPPR